VFGGAKSLVVPSLWWCQVFGGAKTLVVPSLWWYQRFHKEDEVPDQV
jgi:hypothetical protein